MQFLMPAVPRRRAALVALAAPTALALVLLALAGCGSGARSDDGAGDQDSTRSPVRPPAYKQHSPGPVPSRTARLTDPEALSLAYIKARETVTAADATAPPRRTEAYMDPDNPERGLGQPVWDAPPQGTTRRPVGITTEVLRREGIRAVVRATYALTLTDVTTTTATTAGGRITTYLVCEQQPDGTWLVTKEASDLAP